MKRKISSLLFAVLIALSIPLSVSAKEWSADDFTVQVPEEYYTFTKETPTSDPTWVLAGVEDPASIRERFGVEQKSFSLFDIFNIFGGSSSNSNAMTGVVNFISPGGKVDILISRKQSTDSYELYSFADASPSQRQAFLDKMLGKDQESSLAAETQEQDESGMKVETTGTLYDDAAIPFMRLEYTGTYNEENFHEVVYVTILNGETISFDTYNAKGNVSEETLTALKSMVDSIQVTKVTEKTEATVDEGALLQGILLLAGIVVIIVGAIVFMRVRASREKREKKRMADRLSEYHKNRSKDGESTGALRFANVTDCSNDAIRKFAMYQAYLKNLPSLLIGIFFIVLLFVLTILMDSEWWIILLVGALGVYYLYKMITAGSNVEKVQRKIYARGNTQTAKYAFYEEIFRVSGVQSASAYPYFQVTDIGVTKDYVYLYYGPENAYIIQKDGFASGDAQAFVDFIKQKMAEGKQK